MGTVNIVMMALIVSHHLLALGFQQGLNSCSFMLEVDLGLQR